MTASDTPMCSAIRTPEGLEMRIAASPQGLEAAQPVLRRFLDERGLPAALADRAELLVEEVVMNVQMHGFDNASTAEVALRAAVRHDACTLVVEDAGRPFDPTIGDIAERPASLDEATPGGLGLVLLRRLASHVGYRRLPAGRNEVTIVIAAQVPGAVGQAG